MKIIFILITIIILVFALYNIFIYIFNKKITKLEKNIIGLFNERNNLIPSLYEITKKYITKHEEVFYEVLKLRKNNLSSEENFVKRINEEVIIHHEINFIFKVANKHPKIQKDYKFLLIRDLFLENSSKIGKFINIYKIITKKFNKLIAFKNLTIIGLFLDIEKREEI